MHLCTVDFHICSQTWFASTWQGRWQLVHKCCNYTWVQTLLTAGICSPVRRMEISRGTSWLLSRDVTRTRDDLTESVYVPFWKRLTTPTHCFCFLGFVSQQVSCFTETETALLSLFVPSDISVWAGGTGLGLGRDLLPNHLWMASSLRYWQIFAVLSMTYNSDVCYVVRLRFCINKCVTWDWKRLMQHR